MLLHGGTFENYNFSRNGITHFICDNLPDTKLKQLAHERCVCTRERDWGRKEVSTQAEELHSAHESWGQLRSLLLIK